MDYPMRSDLRAGNILDRDRTIYKIYNGWWFVGRPTVEEIRMNLQALMSKRDDWVYPGGGKANLPAAGVH